MKPLNRVFVILQIAFLLSLDINGFSQSKGELGLLTSINPRYPHNDYLKAFSSTAKPISMAIPFGMLAVALLNENKKLEYNAYEVAAGIAISAVATEALKLAINRPRPYLDHGNVYPDAVDDGSSFPSGHTSVVFSTATSLTLIYKKWYVAVPAYTWAAAVGYSRLYLGQHYPSDVFAGAVIGAAGAYTSHWLNKKFFAGKKKNVTKTH
jgi:undecaprenyl-diphosphatase